MKRSDLVADTAITLLAERGMRGLTHRAVDEAAGLPPGSTSNLARTRAALLELTLSRLTELEQQALAGAYTAEAADLARLPELMAQALHIQLTDRRRTLARYELALEATRRPELRRIYDEAGRRFRDPAVAMLAAIGSPDPVAHARNLVAFGEGLMFDAIAGAGSVPTPEELRDALRDLLAGMLRSG
ncbi:Transcriptional regulator, TetR family [[Actinomadura] parvosata subsp. kistnae]|uniref:TetR family transcriptional regulator n=1 Tax=[Actinomadura] parvosata subsp. kistnae TaxID=1909395 RepID=A0A1V0AGR1_9ACTN|nr:TetR family transcriptional regulator C-terminal domain-containing protein [Nonomuraea sp. ATCC 55076]AQZ69272.1 TetR family transcriptional regulator [Nonomuraea sp. ATCC 55076]SPL92102.1 Transcriptional regulator, TetR family [Actinomadura parvosata subsp. kistnae]